MSHTLTLTARLDRAHIAPSGGTVQLLIQVGAEALPAGDRLPLNLAAVVDRSGSMHGPKLAYTKQALLFLVDQVGPQDYLSVITYDDHVETLLPSTHVIRKGPLKAELAQIESGGSTNLSGGMATGMQQIARHARSRQVNRTLLMTDGLANVGVTDPDTLINWAKSWRERGLTLSTLGVGDDFAEDLLVALAEAGGGNFHYIADPDKIPAIFAQELSGLLQVSAQALRLRVEVEPGVAIDGVIGYPPSGSPHAMELSLPDIYSGEVKSVLLALSVAAPPADGRLARVSLDYVPAAPPDPEVLRQVGLVRAALARDEAVRHADRGDLTAGAVALEAAADALAAVAPEDTEVQALRVQASALRGAQYDKVVRKQMRYDSHRGKR